MDPFEFEMREAIAEDVGRIGDFFDAMGEESRALFNRRDYNRNGILKYCAKGDPNRHYWLCLEDGVMLGYVFFLDYHSSIPTVGLAVRDDLRGRGLGRKLITFAQEKAKADGKGGLMLTTHVANLRAQSLYEDTGFTCMGLCKNGTELFYLFRYYEK